MADINVQVIEQDIIVTSPGTQGPAGAGFVWKGAYNPLTPYNPKDTVSYLGSSYVCILASTGNLPTNGTYWEVLASKGDQGISGYSGAAGSAGVSGYSGYSGATGSDGASGFSGYSGATGTNGASGFSGYSGAQGNVGTSGYSGYSGATGTSGFSGYSGATGAQGLSGFSGASGLSGFSGYSGVSGFSGQSGFSGYSGTNGASGISGFSGYSGIDGVSGFSGYSGATGSGTSGFSGYSGEQGTSGFSGFSGSNGQSGYSGYSGTTGATGASGFSGFSGYSGGTGADGTSGFSGYSGFSGQDGSIGVDGASGFSGYSGFSGISGYSGLSGYSGINGSNGTSGFSGYSGYSGSSSSLAWGSAISGVSGTGFTITVGISGASSTVGQSIVIGNTQTQAIIGLNIDTGTSTAANVGIKIKALSGTFDGSAISINVFGVATQALVDHYGVVYGTNFNTNSSFSSRGIYVVNENNAGSGRNTGILINHKGTDFISSGLSSGAGLEIYQQGVGGTAMAITAANNINSSTNGLVNYTISNTQSGATVMQKIDLGTSAQGHTGLLINAFNANTGVRGIKIDGSTTGTGIGLEITGYAATSTNFKQRIKFGTVSIWESDGTTANGNLSGTAGDICFNAGSNKPEYCQGSNNWTALV